MRKFVFLGLVVFGLVVALPLRAQEQTGAICGQVLDNQNLPLPGATVEAKSKSGLVLRAMTDANGRFRFPRLPIDVYDVDTTLSGFQAARVTDLKVDLGKELNVNFTLQPGFAEEVIVTASGAMVDVTSNSTARSFTAEEMASLPLGRDFSSEEPALLLPELLT
ncbi:MAG: carboxypeptidase-like regulatory domain-containing protein [Thermoanaerobaculaceae bacterium]